MQTKIGINFASVNHNRTGGNRINSAHNNMTTYKITRTHQNPYIASRHRQPIVEDLYTGLTLKEAYDILLDMLNNQFDTCYRNWGVAVNAMRNTYDGANKTESDGTRSYDWDSRRFAIEEEE